MIIGNSYCKIKAMKDDRKNHLKLAYPSYAVEIVNNIVEIKWLFKYYI